VQQQGIKSSILMLGKQMGGAYLKRTGINIYLDGFEERMDSLLFNRVDMYRVTITFVPTYVSSH